MPGSTKAVQAERIFREHGGLLHTKEAIELGIHPRTLYDLRDRRVIEPLSRGVYRLTSGPELEQPDLVTVALRVPRAVVCLISALAFYQLTSEVPHEVWVALPREIKKPKLAHPPLRVVRLSAKTFAAGIEIKRVGPAKVKMYSLPKTVADCFRFRNQIGIDVAVEALRLALEKKKAKPADILRFARLWRVERVMRPYFEALQ